MFIPDGKDVVVVEGVGVVADGLLGGAVQRVVWVHRQPVQRSPLEALSPRESSHMSIGSGKF